MEVSEENESSVSESQPTLRGFYPSDFHQIGHSIVFRPMVASDDFLFAWGFYWLFMKSLVSGTALEKIKGQKTEMLESCSANGAMIIEVEGTNAGWIEIESTDEAVHLHQLYLLAELQGLGIGTSIIRQIYAKAHEKPVKLEVLKKNERAFKLYESLGFRVTDSDELKFYMTSEVDDR